MKLSVSILNANNRKETIKILNNTDISYFHIDVMDGNFVSQVSLPVEETLELSKISNKKLDIHLMHSSPLSYIERIMIIIFLLLSSFICFCSSPYFLLFYYIML
jgi:ribulose-phosphate 3-epimerase